MYIKRKGVPAMLTRILSIISMWAGLSALFVNLGASISWSLIMSSLVTCYTHWILTQIYSRPEDDTAISNRKDP